MPIPPQYNGDIVLWINQTVGDLASVMTDIQVLKKYWTSLTTQQKAALKTLLKNKSASTRAELVLIEAELDLI